MEKEKKDPFIQTHTPHDTFVKAYLSTHKECKAFIKAHFDPHITQQLKTVALTNKSYVKREFKQLHSDLVFKLLFKDESLGYAYILCEAESTKPDQLFPFRLFDYMKELITDHMKMNPKEKAWPLVVPGLLYHGIDSPYPYSSCIYDYFKDPSAARRLGIFQQFKLIDLTAMAKETIESHREVVMLEKLLKYSRAKDVLLKVQEIIEEEIKGGRLDLAVFDTAKKLLVIIYVLNILDTKKYSKQEALTLLQDKLQLKRTDMISIAQQLRNEGMRKGMQQGVQQGMKKGMQQGVQQGMKKGMQQGMKKGMQQGMQQGMKKGMQQEKYAIARSMLSKQLDRALITQVTGLSEEALQALQ